jgi:hypothetical protein
VVADLGFDGLDRLEQRGSRLFGIGCLAEVERDAGSFVLHEQPARRAKLAGNGAAQRRRAGHERFERGVRRDLETFGRSPRPSVPASMPWLPW